MHIIFLMGETRHQMSSCPPMPSCHRRQSQKLFRLNLDGRSVPEGAVNSFRILTAPPPPAEPANAPIFKPNPVRVLTMEPTKRVGRPPRTARGARRSRERAPPPALASLRRKWARSEKHTRHELACEGIRCENRDQDSVGGLSIGMMLRLTLGRVGRPVGAGRSGWADRAEVRAGRPAGRGGSDWRDGRVMKP